ncbi:hypothetical protein B0H34DRAFT_411907 [Crassisporium funariophilum]|nr:hypothetical protein B0H34DRAFT_411907 [Crassisporium funariophilum]
MFFFQVWTALRTKKAVALRAPPVHLLPVEILILIFEEYRNVWTPTAAVETPELCISQVCGHWRVICTNLSSLWTTLVTSPRTSSHTASIYLESLTTWRTIKSSAPRWRRLIMQIGPHDATAISEDLRHLQAPLLEELQISSASHVSGITKIFEGGTPSLKSLRLIGISLQRFSPSLHDLTRLDLTSNSPIHFSVFQDIVTKMDKLRELTLRSRVVEGWPLYPSPEDIITLPSLRVLKVSDRRWPLFIPLLSISAPVLHTLNLHDLVAHDLPETFMESQISDNFPSIRNLILKGKSTYIDDMGFGQLARIFPAIHHFALMGVDDFFIRESSYIMHQTCVWPKLRAITMMPVVEEDILCSLISARTIPSTETSLKTFFISVPTEFKRIDWISQQVSIEKCPDPSSSFSSSHITSETTPFEYHYCSDNRNGRNSKSIE